MGRGGRSRLTAAGAAAAALLGTAASSAQVPTLPEPSTQPAKARIVYQAGLGLRTIAADGSDMRKLTAPPGEPEDPGDTDGPGDREPVWAPGGDSIAFTRTIENPDGDEQDQRVWVMRADGSEARPLTAKANPFAFEFGPTFSPDGREVALVRVRVGDKRFVSSLIAVNLGDGSRRTVHTETTEFDDEAAFLENAAWSPNGDTILFTRTTLGLEDDFRPSIHAVPAAGGPARRVLRDAAQPAWSPDGNRIAYSGVKDRLGRSCAEQCVYSGEIYVANADGGDPKRLTTSRADDADPSWSGDGQRIAFHSDRNSLGALEEEALSELYSIKPDGSCLTWLTNGTANSESPAFQPDPSPSSDPGGCGPSAREPLVETDLRKVESFRRFPAWWLGPVAPNGLLATDSFVGRERVFVAYGDCGRFDPAECGEFVNVASNDLCRGSAPAARARPADLSSFRGALVHLPGGDEIGLAHLYTHRTRIETDITSGRPVPRAVLDMLRPVGGERAAGAKFPATRLPKRAWRAVQRKPELRRRLAKLGVRRRLGC